MIVRRIVNFGDGDTATVSQGDQINLQVRPSTAVTGIGLWVAAGVLTHIAVRVVDHWLDGPRKKE